jgi:AcrR family transcriptional regulator
MSTGRVLSTAEARRASVLRAGVRVFADRGYYGTTTTQVAQEARISQAYVYRLFPDKETLYLTVLEHAFDRIRTTLSEAADDVAAGPISDDSDEEIGSSSPERVLSAMTEAHAQLLADRDLLLIQLHAQAAAVSEPSIRRAVRNGYASLVELVRSRSGADDGGVQQFFARAFLCHAVAALDSGGSDEPQAAALATLSRGLRHHPTTTD